MANAGPALDVTLANARRAFQQRDYDTAIELAAGLLKAQPGYAPAYFLMSMIRLHSGSSAPPVMSAVKALAEVRRRLSAEQAWQAATAHLGVASSHGTSIVGHVAFEGLNELRGALVQGPSELGLFSYVGYHSLVGSGSCIGRYCSIAMNSTIGPGEHTAQWLTSHNFALGKPNVEPEVQAAHLNQRLAIGHDVWVGANAFVSTDITIGHGAVIGGGAAVVKDVPPYAIVGGTPARLIRLRFPEKAVERLLASEWWRLPIDHVRLLPFHDLDRCLDRIEALRAELPAESLI